MEDRNKKKLSDFTEKQIKATQKQILDIAELVIPPGSWKAFRSKVLGITNDLRRELDKEVEANYMIKYDPRVSYEDVIEVQTSKNGLQNNRTGNDNGKE